MLCTMWVTVLTIALQIHNSEPQPVKLGRLNSNFTIYPLEIGHNATTLATKLEATNYPVPGTDMNLKITADPTCPLSKEVVMGFIVPALHIAASHDESTLLEKVSRLERESDSIIFAISPQVYYIELTWGDVVNVVRSLQKYFEESAAWADIKFEIEDKMRGDLGSGTIGWGSCSK